MTAPVPEAQEPFEQTPEPEPMGDRSGSRTASDGDWSGSPRGVGRRRAGLVEAESDRSNPGVDAALADLDAAAGLEPAQQVAAYEQAHKALSQILAAIDQS